MLGAVAFLLVFFLVTITSTLVTFILPEAYASSARIRLDNPLRAEGQTNSLPSEPGADNPQRMQTELEIIQSEAVLRKVVEELDLNTTWGRKYAGGAPLKTRESMMILKGQLDPRPVRGTSLIEIKVFSDRPDEAARLANAITAAYAAYASHSEALRVQVVDTAHPSARPAKPNKPLNIVLGIVVGVVMGLGCALFTFWIADVLRR